MTHSRPERLLDYAAQRAKVHPDYLGWVLARYMAREHISEAELVTRLGSTHDALPHLALCLRPRPEHFAADIRQISAKFHSDATALAGIVRLVESLASLATSNSAAPVDAGLLMAARARKQPRQDQDEGSHDRDPTES